MWPLCLCVEADGVLLIILIKRKTRRPLVRPRLQRLPRRLDPQGVVKPSSKWPQPQSQPQLFLHSLHKVWCKLNKTVPFKMAIIRDLVIFAFGKGGIFKKSFFFGPDFNHIWISRQNDLQFSLRIDISACQIWLKLKFCLFEIV